MDDYSVIACTIFEMRNIFLLVFAHTLSQITACQDSITYRYSIQEHMIPSGCEENSCEKPMKTHQIIDTQTVTCSKINLNNPSEYSYQYAEHHHLVITESTLPQIPKNKFFPNFAYFDKLTLKNLHIANISKGVFDDFDLLQELDLSLNQLEAFPEAILTLSNLYTLDLSNNKIEKLEGDFSTLYNLRFLFLRNNNLKNISAEDFGSLLTSLIEIDVSGNPLIFLGDIKTNSLRRLVARNTQLDHLNGDFYGVDLELIDLSNNRFTEFEIFNSLHSKQLILKNNSFTTIDNYPPSVNYLDFSHNKINTFSIYLSRANVQSVDLSFNKISELKPHTFAYCGLISLYLSHNRLEILQGETFHNCSLLRIIDLSSNKLSYLHRNVFNNLPSLTTLDLSNNQLRDLNLLMVLRASALEYLLISNNKIVSFDIDRFVEVFPDLESIALNGNLWFCEDLEHYLNTLELSRNIYITDGFSYNVKNIRGIACKL